MISTKVGRHFPWCGWWSRFQRTSEASLSSSNRNFKLGDGCEGSRGQVQRFGQAGSRRGNEADLCAHESASSRRRLQFSDTLSAFPVKKWSLNAKGGVVLPSSAK